MHKISFLPYFYLLTVFLYVGCAASQSGKKHTASTGTISNQAVSDTPALVVEDSEEKEITSTEINTETAVDEGLAETEEKIEPVVFVDDENPELFSPEEVDTGENLLELKEVIQSVYSTYPLVRSALFSRNIASGQNLSALGAFDLKIKAASENAPQGFYKTYRQSVGLIQPLYSGSEVWGGYRIGRGSFQPWYLERQTNDGGELKAGVTVPLLQNRDIDERRTELWKSRIEIQLAEYDIQAQVIASVQEASYAYWEWVSAGRNYLIAKEILELATSRTNRIERQVKAGLIDPPELTDNLRLVAERKAKLALSEQKLNQKAVKLSLYLRNPQGEPVIPSFAKALDFPEPYLVDQDKLNQDIQLALTQRPDLKVFNLLKQQFDIDLSQARNEMKPDVSAVVWGSQDMGEPTSSKRDKSQYEMEASLFLDVPFQRRKAQGKIRSIEGKIQQLLAKRELTENKIGVEVQSAYAGLIAAYEQVLRTREAVDLAEDLARRERKNFEEGASDLLKVTLREQYSVEASIKEVDALLIFYLAMADYEAALATYALNLNM